MKSQFVRQRVLPGVATVKPTRVALAESDQSTLAGVEFEELLSVGSGKPGLSRRWTAAVLAVMAGVVCMGLGGRAVLGAPDSNRNADPVAVAAGGSTSDPGAPASAQTSESPEAAPASIPADPERLPLGFAIEPLPTSSRGGIQRIVVVGFVGRRQSVLLRVVEPDGTVAAATTAASRAGARSATTVPALWAFQAVLDIPPGARGSGPDSSVLEVRWTPEAGAEVLCSIPLPGTWPAFAAGAEAAAVAASEPLTTMARCS